MKVNELRIGNIITDKWSEGKYPFRVTSIGKTKCTYSGDQEFNAKYENIEPIPLTEEWLLKFGFKKDNETEFHIHSNNNHLIYIYFEKLRNCYAMIYNGSQFTEVKYVHQLQNLYLALTGEELAIA